MGTDVTVESSVTRNPELGTRNLDFLAHETHERHENRMGKLPANGANEREWNGRDFKLETRIF